MRLYIDTSSVLAWLLREPSAARVADAWDAASCVASSSLLQVEARAGLARALRGRRLTRTKHAAARHALLERINEIDLVPPEDRLLIAAADLAETFNLRGYDAIHLASAQASTADAMATRDRQLSEAARALGFDVVQASSERT